MAPSTTDPTNGQAQTHVVRGPQVLDQRSSADHVDPDETDDDGEVRASLAAPA
jgi:hypothetical protein